MQMCELEGKETEKKKAETEKDLNGAAEPSMPP